MVKRISAIPTKQHRQPIYVISMRIVTHGGIAVICIEDIHIALIPQAAALALAWHPIFKKHDTEIL